MLIVTDKALMLIAVMPNVIMLIVTYNPFMLSVVKLIVIMQSVIILSVTVSKKIFKKIYWWNENLVVKFCIKNSVLNTLNLV